MAKKCRLPRNLEKEWAGRPEATLRFLKCKYGKKVMKTITKKVLK